MKFSRDDASCEENNVEHGTFYLIQQLLKQNYITIIIVVIVLLLILILIVIGYRCCCRQQILKQQPDIELCNEPTYALIDDYGIYSDDDTDYEVPVIPRVPNLPLPPKPAFDA